MPVLPVLAVLMALVIGSEALALSERELVAGGLHGTLTLPDGDGVVPTALILPGSGPVDRNGNLPGARNDSLKLVAHRLADAGIASLRIDKRGVGASAAAGVREEDLRLDTFVEDAISWIDALHAEERAGAITLIGHSEGALVATLAAQARDVSGVILMAGAGEPAGAVIRRQLGEAGVSDPLKAASDRILQQLEQGKRAEDVPPELISLYRQSVQAYMISWLARDPAHELAKLAVPVLIVQGSTDLQVSMRDAERLKAAAADARLVILEGMNHVLKLAPVDRAQNLATYNADLPLASGLVDALASFITR